MTMEKVTDMFSALTRNLEQLSAAWPELAASVDHSLTSLMECLEDMSALQAKQPNPANPDAMADQLQAQLAQQTSNALLEARAHIESYLMQAAQALAHAKRAERRILIARAAAPRIIKQAGGGGQSD
jgi:hypothetical protein